MNSKRTTRLARAMLAMAWDRPTFKGRLLGNYQAALEHFYRVQFALLNGQTDLTDHWKTEVDRLLSADTLSVLMTQTKGKWDKRKACDEVLLLLRKYEKSSKVSAMHYVKNCYGLRKMKIVLPLNVSISFYQKLEKLLNYYLEDHPCEFID